MSKAKLLSITEWSNERPAVDAGWSLLFAFSHTRPRATEAGCWAKANDSASNAVQREA